MRARFCWRRYFIGQLRPLNELRVGRPAEPSRAEQGRGANERRKTTKRPLGRQTGAAKAANGTRALDDDATRGRQTARLAFGPIARSHWLAKTNDARRRPQSTASGRRSGSKWTSVARTPIKRLKQCRPTTTAGCQTQPSVWLAARRFLPTGRQAGRQAGAHRKWSLATGSRARPLANPSCESHRHKLGLSANQASFLARKMHTGAHREFGPTGAGQPASQPLWCPQRR